MTVTISPGQGSIVEVTSEAVRFTDADGNPGTANLRPLQPEAPKVVGEHNLKEEPCWVLLDGTRFEFETRKAAYEELVDPMLRIDRLTRRESRFRILEDIPEGSPWNYVLILIAVAFLVLLFVFADQLWLKWFVGTALLRAAYDGVVYLRKKRNGAGEVR